MHSRVLAVASVAGLVVAGIYRPPPRNQLEADIWAAIDPVLNWNNDLFGMTAEDDTHADKWHGPDGKSNVTHAIVDAFYKDGVAKWNTAGKKLAELVKKVDTHDATEDYVSFLNSIFPDSYLTTIPWRLSVYWNSQLNISEAEVKVWAAQYDTAWYNAILAVEKNHASVTRDHEVSNEMFWDSGGVRGDFFYKVADKLDSVPWEPIVRYCDYDNYGNTCNNRLKTYPPNKCYSTADINKQAQFIGVGNAARGFPWVCQAYTDNACQTAVFIPAQPCTYPPPWDVYCPKTTDWDGKFGNNNPRSTSANPSGLTTVNVGSFKCT